MKPITGRYCENCAAPIAPWRRRGTRFCDSSCRSEHARMVRAKRGARRGKKTRRSVHGKPQRGNTQYVVFRLELAASGLFADLELVGFARSRKRERAIEKVTGLGITEETSGQYVAVPIRALTPYYSSGEKVKEVPGYEIAP